MREKFTLAVVIDNNDDDYDNNNNNNNKITYRAPHLKLFWVPMLHGEHGLECIECT